MAVSLSRLLMGTLPAAALLAASPSWAQTQAQVPATALDPVTVTATKTPRQVDEVPASVRVIGPEEIERRVPRTVNDVFGDTPGVEITGGPRRNALDVNIRGFEGQRVVTTVDGARQNFDAGHKGRFFIDPDLLKQVDILKGPASTLYGSGALGGVVAMKTKDASDFLEAGEVGAVRGKYGYSSVRREPFYSVTGATRPEQGIDILGSFAYRNSGSMRQGGDRELGDSREQLHSGLFKMGFDPGNGHRLFGSYSMFIEHGPTPSNAESNFNGTDVFRMDRRSEQNTGTFGYAFENADSPLWAPTATVYRNQIDITENRLNNATPRLDETSLVTSGLDLRNTSKLGDLGLGSHTLTYGTEFYNDSQDGSRNGAARPGYPGAQNYVTGFYVQDEIVLGAFSIIPGARFDKYSLQSDASTTKNDESRLSPRLGAVWRTTPWLNLFASYAEAFRAPSLTEMYISGTHFPGNTFINNPNLKPETVKTYEAGARLKFNDVITSRDQLRFRTSAFYTKADDYIDLFIVGANAQYQNISKAKLDGFEAETLYDTPRLFGSLGFATVTGENRSSSTARALNSLQGDRFTATAGSKLPEWDLLLGVRSQVVLEQNNVDRTMFDTVQRTGGYAVHGLFASWQPSSEKLRGFRLDGGIDNIGDKAYRRHQSTLYQEGRDVYGAVSYTMKF